MLGIVAYFQKMSFQDPRKKYGGFVKGGHEWQSIIYNRVKGVGCPICANKQVLTGYNDLETISPSLAKEWSYESELPPIR